MKGVVFVIFEEFVIDGWGEEVFESLLDVCPHVAAEPIVSPSTYPDAWIVDMLNAACKRLGVDAPTALRAFGRFAFPELHRRFPVFADGCSHPKEFLLSVHDLIHVEVRKLMEEARPPAFTYEDTGLDTLLMRYDSPRNLCFLMEGLLDGVGEHFGVAIEHSQPSCTHRGDAGCMFSLRFAEPWVKAA